MSSGLKHTKTYITTLPTKTQCFYFSPFLLLYSGWSSDLTTHMPRWAKETNVMNHTNVGECIWVNSVVSRAKGHQWFASLV